MTSAIRPLPDAVPGPLPIRETRNVDPVRVDDRSPRIRCCDEQRPLFPQKPRRVMPNRTKPLHDDSRSIECQSSALRRNLGGVQHPPPGRAQLVERDPTQRPW